MTSQHISQVTFNILNDITTHITSTCSTNHENGVEGKAIHGRQPSKACGERWAEVNGVSAQKFGFAEMKLKQPQDSQVSGEKSQPE